MRSDAYAAQMRALVAARQCPLGTNSKSSLTESVDAYRFARIQMQAATSRHGSTRAQSCHRRHGSDIRRPQYRRAKRTGSSQICLTSHANRLTIGGGVRLRAAAALNERFPKVQLGCRILTRCLTVLL